MVSKSQELYNRIIGGSVDNYFNDLSNDDFNALSKAIADDDIGDMIAILSNNLKNQFQGFDGALNENYDAEVRELAKRILRKNLGSVEEVIEEVPPSIISGIDFIRQDVRVRMTPERSYRRSKPKKFSIRELNFLNRRLQDTGTQVYNAYISVFGSNRTKSSVTTKLYRLRV